jgi:diguanylate cyclase (GGDEF)-like protein/PAS domain S-box-containing protein
MAVASMFLAAAASSALSIVHAVLKLRDKHDECDQLRRQGEHSKQQLKRHAALIHSFHQTNDWYWEMDKNFRFVALEGKAATQAAFISAEQLGLSPWEIPASNLSPADWVVHRQTLNSHLPFDGFEICRVTPSGEEFWVSISGKPIMGDRNTFLGYSGIAKTITALKTAKEQIERLALADEMTGLPNRRMLLSRLPQVISQTRRRSTRMALLLVSLNSFKLVNQRHGNQVGDLVLREIALRLRNSVRTSDTVARYSGDVFAILLEEVMGNDAVVRVDVRKLASKYLALCAQAVQVFDAQISCTASIGFTVSSALTQSAQQIISDAETGLAAAKAEGPNSFRIWPTEAVAAEVV